MDKFMIALADFHFLRPAFLLGLVLLPWLARALASRRAGSGLWQRAVDAHLLPFLLIGRGGGGASAWPRRLALSAWLIAVLALAGPAWERLPEPVYERLAPRVFVLDLSASMNAADLAPSRLVRARYKLLDLLDRQREGQAGLVAYAGDAHVIAPLTPDARTLANLVPALAPELMPKAGSRADLAVAKALELLKQAGFRQGEILMLTDGVDTEAADAVADALSGSPYRLSILGVGSADGAPIPLPKGRGFLKDAAGNIVIPRLDAASLRALASAGGGRYAELAADDADLDRLLPDSLLLDNAVQSEQARHTERWADRGPWLLVLLLPLALAGFQGRWLGLALVFGLGMLTASRPAQALSWDELWRRADQQAAEKLQAGDAQAAAQQFRDPAWQGAAWYRAGDYAKAAQAFAADDTARGHYNRGNALAKQGKTDEAIQAYERALALAPDLDDAKFNRELLKRQQEQNSPQNSQSSSQGQSSKDGQQGQSGQGQEPKPGQEHGDGQADKPQTGDASDSAKGEASGKKEQPAQDAAGQRPEDQASGEDNAPAPPLPSPLPRGEREQEAQDPAGGQVQKAEPAQEPAQDKAAQALPGSDGQGEDANPYLEQRLRAIPDDPAGLLREKMRRESLRQKAPTQESEIKEPW
ncbi:MAG: VWA domain-containing protein [Gammaproteobacteria bacterium]|nr:VWA domain-containing protein [Gammaproteobacteria bacterium]